MLAARNQRETNTQNVRLHSVVGDLDLLRKSRHELHHRTLSEALRDSFNSYTRNEHAVANGRKACLGSLVSWFSTDDLLPLLTPWSLDALPIGRQGTKDVALHEPKCPDF